MVAQTINNSKMKSAQNHCHWLKPISYNIKLPLAYFMVSDRILAVDRFKDERLSVMSPHHSDMEWLPSEPSHAASLCNAACLFFSEIKDKYFIHLKKIHELITIILASCTIYERNSLAVRDETQIWGFDLRLEKTEVKNHQLASVRNRSPRCL